MEPKFMPHILTAEEQRAFGLIRARSLELDRQVNAFMIAILAVRGAECNPADAYLDQRGVLYIPDTVEPLIEGAEGPVEASASTPPSDGREAPDSAPKQEK